MVHEASVLVVILNAMRLLRTRRSVTPRKITPVAPFQRRFIR